MLNNELEDVGTVTQTSTDLTLTFTTKACTATTALTIADGSTADATEIHTALVSLQTQIDRLVVEVAALVAGT